jgi:hypothetical protein
MECSAIKPSQKQSSVDHSLTHIDNAKHFQIVPEKNTWESFSAAVAYEKYPKLCDNLCDIGIVLYDDPSWDNCQPSST